MSRRLAWMLVVPLATVALIVTVGPPDARRAFDGVASGGRSSGGAFATISFLCWAIVGLLVISACLGALRGARVRLPRPLRHYWPLVVVGGGLALLAAGLVHHQLAYRVCCANSATAQQAERLAR